MSPAIVAQENGNAFLPLEALTLSGPAQVSEAEVLAVMAFNQRVQTFTGVLLPVAWGTPPDRGALLVAGTLANRREDLDAAALEAFQDAAPGAAQQSYLIAVQQGPQARLLAIGGGAGSEARDSLGLSYALGVLLRCLELREGVWGFLLPESPVVGTPDMPERTLYINSGAGRPRGVSLEHFTDAELEAYVDFLLEARYSRISFWQAHPSYLYPGNAEPRRALNQHMHQVLRHIFTYAQRRGLEIYHQITPAYYDPMLLGDPEPYRGVGWYTEKAGHGGICWSKPEAREMGLRITRHEMEYFAPVDGYVVWFYDPAGCFCDDCRPNQAAVLFDQFQLVADLAKTISPGAALQAVLWPTWIFPEYEDDGIPFNAEQRDAFVTAFLQQVAATYPAQAITIVDSSEGPNTNIHNGLVDPAHFKLNGFIYSLLGYPGESAYVFMPFRFHEQMRVLRNARDYRVQEVTLYDHYAPVTFPIVYGFAHLLYDAKATDATALRAYAATIAKGDAQAPFVRLLEALEAMDKATSYEARAEHLTQAEDAWKHASASPHLYMDRGWIEGYLRAQRHYLALARSDSPEAFTSAYTAFVEELSTIPMYREFMTRSLTPEAVANLQLIPYWRGPCNDVESAGIPHH